MNSKKNGVMYQQTKTYIYNDSGHYEKLYGPVYSPETKVRNGFSIEKDKM